MNLLICGGCGFIGSNFIRYILKNRPNYKIIVLDALTYAGNLNTIQDLIDSKNIVFLPGKIQDECVVEGAIKSNNITHIINFAAETHNDRSILYPGSFIQTDVYGVYVLLEYTKKYNLKKMVHVSTDEVYGSILDGQFCETDPLMPNTPYSASKAGGDLQVRAHHNTYGTPVVITRGGNTYGPYQYPEKLIPFFLSRLIDNKKIPLYGSGSQKREWIHVDDHCAGVLTALESGIKGEIYNIGDHNEYTNLEITNMLLKYLNKSEDLILSIDDPRKLAHDFRYSLDTSKMHSLGWTPKIKFEDGIKDTIDWYINNQNWWRELINSEEYINFFNQFYEMLK